jgi:hypothetical protein
LCWHNYFVERPFRSLGSLDLLAIAAWARENHHRIELPRCGSESRRLLDSSEPLLQPLPNPSIGDEQLVGMFYTFNQDEHDVFTGYSRARVTCEITRRRTDYPSINLIGRRFNADSDSELCLSQKLPVAPFNKRTLLSIYLARLS